MAFHPSGSSPAYANSAQFSTYHNRLSTLRRPRSGSSPPGHPHSADTFHPSSESFSDFVPSDHWYNQHDLGVNTSFHFGIASATMTADNTMQAHLHQAAAQIAGFGGDSGDMFADCTNDGNDNFTNQALADTVSPTDLAYSHDDFSPDLHQSMSFDQTPSLLDDNSPFLNSTDCSPAFENYQPARRFAPLFPQQEDEPAQQPKKRKHGEPDIASSTESLSGAGSGQAMERTVSAHSNTDDRGMLRQRLSSTAGIPKSTRRQSRNLAPIEVDSADETAAKRAKNTMAARKSRQKKKDEVAMLEDKLMQLIEERDYWKMTAVKYGAPMPASPTPSAMSPPS